ncbi:hypothetical protein evm_004342 [Chilo suppressalis]|nr:hypothetical protein evm_004342 [Chilo suppressalis]
MQSTITILMIAVYVTVVKSLKPLSNRKFSLENNGDEKDLKTTLQLLRVAGEIQNGRRAPQKSDMNGFKLTKPAKYARSSNVKYPQVNARKRSVNEGDKDEQAVIVEKELLDTYNKETSALLHRPYVEKKGYNDFLVMKPHLHDPYVTVVPNAIFYDIEKKCVNWLDDCSLRGIRAKLLHKVNWPYK